MSIYNYIYSKLSAASGVTSLVSTRIYPQVMPQDELKPSIVFNIVSNGPNNTKSAGSALDEIRIQFTSIAETTNTYNGQSKIDEIGEAVRNVFKFVQNDTAASVTVAQSFFDSENDYFDPSGGKEGCYMKAIDFKFWVKK